MDELNTYLMNKYPEYITGRTDCNLLIWGTDEYDAQTPKLCTLIVGVEYDPLTSTKEHVSDLLNRKFAANDHFRRMYKFGDKIASKGSVPYIVLGFPSFRNDYANKWEDTAILYSVENVQFYLHEMPPQNDRLITGTELKRYIYNVLGKSYTDAGTAKAKNKSIADYFQFWSRSFLSRHLVKLDIDGMFSNSTNGVIIEIKRSNKPPIPDWRPYKDDYPDFALLKKFADSLKMDFTILHHNGLAACSADTVISLFEVQQFISINTGMTYRKQELQLKLEGVGSLNSYLLKYL